MSFLGWLGIGKSKKRGESGKQQGKSGQLKGELKGMGYEQGRQRLRPTTGNKTPRGPEDGIKWTHQGQEQPLPEHAMVREPEIVFRGEKDSGKTYKSIEHVKQHGFQVGGKVKNKLGDKREINTYEDGGYVTEAMKSMTRHLNVSAHYSVGQGGAVYAILLGPQLPTIDVSKLPNMQKAQELVTPDVGREHVLGYRPYVSNQRTKGSNTVKLGEFVPLEGFKTLQKLQSQEKARKMLGIDLEELLAGDAGEFLLKKGELDVDNANEGGRK